MLLLHKFLMRPKKLKEPRYKLILNSDIRNFLAKDFVENKDLKKEFLTHATKFCCHENNPPAYKIFTFIRLHSPRVITELSTEQLEKYFNQCNCSPRNIMIEEK